MSISQEITRIQNAKASLKTSINAKTDQQHQITNETIDHYSDFVDSITSGSSYPPDWSQIGYSDTPQNIIDSFNYSKTIYDNWNSTITSMNQMFKDDLNLEYMPFIDTSNVLNMQESFSSCKNLIYIPLLNTSNCTNMSYAFYNCDLLTTIPLLDTSNCTNMSYAFQNCSLLTTIPLLNTSKVTTMRNMISGSPLLNTNSLDNVLQMCINTSSAYTRAKTFKDLVGVNTTMYSTSTLQALPHYQDFINAGWTIGY